MVGSKNIFSKKRIVLSIAAAMAINASAVLADSAESREISIDVKPQSVGYALVEIGALAGVQVILPKSVDSSIEFAGLKGSYTLKQALDTVLEGTGFGYELSSDNTVLIKSEEPVTGGQGVDGDDVDEELVVTGSRIKRSELEVSTPMSVLGADRLRARGFTNIADLLKESPLVVGSRTAGSTAGNAGNVGVETVSLRGLSSLSGSSRTLTLVNGRRHVASIPGSTDVDVSTIPASLLDRVEIITGGSSAVYGSEAIAGVINYVMKKDFEGFDVSAQYGKAGAGDAENKSFALTWGKNFENSNLTLNFERNETAASLLDNRSFTTNENIFLLGPDGSMVFDPHTRTTTAGGTPTVSGRPIVDTDGSITGTPGALLRFGPGGQLVEFVQSATGGSISSGGDGQPNGRIVFPSQDILTPPVERSIFNVFYNHQLTDNTSLFVEGKYTDVKATARDGGLGFLSIRGLPVSTPNIDPVAVAQLTAQGVTSFDFLRGLGEITPLDADLDTELFRVVAGLEGTWADRYDWQFSINYGKTERVSDRIDYSTPAVTAAVLDGSLNLFGPNADFSAVLPSITLSPRVDDKVEQKVAVFSVSGPLLELPAGTMKFAVGAEYREEDVLSDVNADAAINGLVYGSGQSVSGGFDTKEVFAELSIPVLADVPGADLLSVDVSARGGDYSTVGRTYSWNSGLSWVPTEGVRFRSSIGSANRAPSGAELFRPEQATPLGFYFDPCSPGFLAVNLFSQGINGRGNCGVVAPGLDYAAYDALLANLSPDPTLSFLQLLGFAQDPSSFVFTPGVLDIVQNNPELKEETADTFTAGVVLTPTFLEGLTITLDYWSLDVSDAIEILDFNDYNDFCILGSSDSTACAVVTRDPVTSSVISQTSQYTNVTEINLSGFDFAADYQMDIGGGVASVGVNGTYLTKFNEVSSATGDTVDRVGFLGGSDRFAANATGNYLIGPMNFFLQARYQDGRDGSLTVGPGLAAPSVTYFDASVTWQVDENMSLTFGGSNILDRKPASNAQQFVTGYDTAGRSYYLNFTSHFE